MMYEVWAYVEWEQAGLLWNRGGCFGCFSVVFPDNPPLRRSAPVNEVRMLATNCMNLNLPLTEEATSSEFALQCVSLVKGDNRMRSFSTPDLW